MHSTYKFMIYNNLLYTRITCKQTIGTFVVHLNILHNSIHVFTQMTIHNL